MTTPSGPFSPHRSDDEVTREPLALRLKPGIGFRIARVLTQVAAWSMLVLSPLLGAWQRADASSLSSWIRPDGWDPPPALLTAVFGPAGRGETIVDRWPWLGGGTGVEILGLPVVDPVAGLAGVVRALPDAKGALALLLPLLLALFAGRAFCGWFCPFGTIARALVLLFEVLPRAPRRHAIGERRPLRFVVLGLILVSSALGAQSLVVLTLPHLALAQGALHLWLQGGGGAILGWVMALVVVGVVFGPTTYCATLCPTGALLSLVGRFRPVRLRIEDPIACGSCHRCDVACWLSLHPSTGDAGPDCDNCHRCSLTCPHENLRVGLLRGKRKALPIVVGAALLAVVAPAARADEPKVRPRLLLDAHHTEGDVDVAVGVLDLSEVRLDADAPDTVGGSEISVRVTRGARAPSDARGRLGERPHHKGPLTIVVEREGGELSRNELPAPNSPRSTVNRKIYTVRVAPVLRPGDVVIVEAVPDFLAHDTRFVLGRPSRTGTWGSFGVFFLAGLLAHAGALAVALALGARDVPHGTPPHLAAPIDDDDG